MHLVSKEMLFVWSEAGQERAIFVRGGGIADVGPASAVARRSGGIGPTHLRGVLRPAALDGHIHLVEFGLSLGEADLSGCDAAEAVERLRRQPRRGGWLLGRGASVEVLREIGRDRSFLLAVSPLRVWAHDFHTALTDPLTLRDLGLAQAEDPLGGRIDRDPSGSPTGVLYETAA
ncbi:Metal-dependent hydrolase, partial [mine drainage metagenome]